MVNLSWLLGDFINHYTVGVAYVNTVFDLQDSTNDKYLVMQYTQYLTKSPGGGVLDFGLDGGVPPGPRDPNPCLEVKKVPMFRDFAQKMDPCLGIFWKFSGLALRAQKIFVILTKNGPMFRDLGVKNGTHV